MRGVVQVQPTGGWNGGHTVTVTSAAKRTHDRIVVAHGGGGELMGRLIRDHLLEPLRNETLAGLTDGAVLPWSSDDVVFTTDSYVVTPIEFPGGDIGRIAVAGTVNDLCVMGAEPVALSLGLILEEGLALETLDRVMGSIRATADEAGVQVVTGDTKVIERRSDGESGLFINTAGVGRRLPNTRLGLERVAAGDVVLINGRIAEHGLAVMSVREGIEFDTKLGSDAAPLNGLVRTILDSGVNVKFMRDATRGGIAGVFADVAETAGLSVEVDEQAIPLSTTARHAAEMLGLDPLTIANEGKLVLVVAAEDADRALGLCRSHVLGKEAAIIGRVTDAQPALVELLTTAGGKRVVQRPYGEDLPRIC